MRESVGASSGGGGGTPIELEHSNAPHLSIRRQLELDVLPVRRPDEEAQVKVGRGGHGCGGAAPPRVKRRKGCPCVTPSFTRGEL